MPQIEDLKKEEQSEELSREELKEGLQGIKLKKTIGSDGINSRRT